MKKRLSVILVLLLLLSGCQHVPEDPIHEPSKIPTEESFNPWDIENWDELWRRLGAYTSVPEGSSLFRCSNISNYSFRDKIDETKLTDDALYVYHEAEEKYFLITDQPIKKRIYIAAEREISCATEDHYYYTPAAEPNKVYRSDYKGTNQVVYESSYGEISSIDYVGLNESGKLLVCEGNRYAVFIDIPTGQREVLVEDDNMYTCWFDYNHYTLDALRKTFVICWERQDSDWGLWVKDLMTGHSRQVRFDPIEE